MKVTILGSGTPTPLLEKASSGYLIEIGDDVIVVDHGPGAHNRLLQAGKQAIDVTHFFLSHMHSDHCLDYPRLLLQRWDIGAGLIPELEVYGPQPIKRFTEQLIGKDGAFAPDINARISHQGSIDIFEARGGKPPRNWPSPNVHEVKAGDSFAPGEGWTVTVGHSTHGAPFLTTCGYRFETPEASVCYGADSGGVSQSIIDLARGADVLIHMCHYYTGTEPTEAYREGSGNHIDTAHVAQQAGVKTLVLTHQLEQIEQPGIRERIVIEMSKIFDGTIIWGHDLLEIPIQPVTLGPMR